MKISAVILAAGSGNRMKSSTKKQFMEINGVPVIWYALKAFQESIVDEIILVTSKEDIEFCNKIVEQFGFSKVISVIEGGKERYNSVYNALCKINTDYIFVHDGARPFLEKHIIEKCIVGVIEHNACVVGVPVKDTIKVINDERKVISTPDRSSLWITQTPQVFKFDILKQSYDKMMKDAEINITDDAMVVERYSDTDVYFIEGTYENIKLTTPEDLWFLERSLSIK